MNVHTTPLAIQDRIEIGLPIKQLDSDECEYPAKLDGQLIGFYASHHAAELALTNIALALDMGIISPLDIMPRGPFLTGCTALRRR